MKASSVPAGVKRGCLWYVGIIVAGAFGLFVLFIAAVIVSIVNEPSQQSIMVSTDDQTYLEAETTNHGEGFLDGYDWLEVYYVRRGWFQNKRVQMYNFPHASASNVSFRRLEGNGQVTIEVKQKGYNQDSVILATFVQPAKFPEK